MNDRKVAVMADAHLTLLTRRRASLPERFAGRADAWGRAATAVGEALGWLCGREAAPVTPELSLVSASDLGAGPAGTLAALAGPEGTEGAEGFIRFGPDDTRLLSQLLLSEDAPADGEDAIAPLDRQLMIGVAEEVIAAVNALFGSAYRVAGAAVDEWPLGMAGAYLSVSLPCVLGERRVSPTLLLAGPPDLFAGAPDGVSPCPRLAAAARDASVAVSAIVDSWRVTGAEAAALKPGQVLTMPGASVETLSVVIALPEGAKPLAIAELGQARGQQAVRLTTPPRF